MSAVDLFAGDAVYGKGEESIDKKKRGRTSRSQSEKGDAGVL
jgi:hypothetical protein